MIGITNRYQGNEQIIVLTFPMFQAKRKISRLLQLFKLF